MALHPFGATHYVLPRSDVGFGRHAMVKSSEYFMEQGGLSKPWGRAWVPVLADGLEHARILAWFIGSGTEYPSSINFTAPNTKTLGEFLDSGWTSV